LYAEMRQLFMARLGAHEVDATDEKLLRQRRPIWLSMSKLPVFTTSHCASRISNARNAFTSSCSVSRRFWRLRTSLSSPPAEQPSRRGADPNTPAGDVFNPYRVGLDHVALACHDETELQRVVSKLESANVENTGIKLDPTLNKRYVAFKDPERIQWELYMAN